MTICRVATCLLLLCISPASAPAQARTPAPGCPKFDVGADVSFLPQAEAEGTVFRDRGKAEEGLEILKRHGYGWVRLRLFNDPKTLPNNLDYTLSEAKRARALGYRVLLDFHYSDDWADPAHQLTPALWQQLTHEQLTAAVFAYTRDTLVAFRQAGALPDMVQVGNEITSGMLWPDGKLPEHWDNFLDLLRAGVRGVAAGSAPASPPPVMLHIDKGANIEATKWFFSHVNDAHVPFDIIGQSFYPWWQGSIDDLKANLAFMAQAYRKPIIVAEAAYSWMPDNYIGKPGPFPETPAGQQAFLQAVSDAVAATPDGLGRGVFWWEPAVRGPLARRGLFSDDGNALPAMDVFNACAAPTAKDRTR